jgi:hypothetical protein
MIKWTLVNDTRPVARMVLAAIMRSQNFRPNIGGETSATPSILKRGKGYEDQVEGRTNEKNIAGK